MNTWLHWWGEGFVESQVLGVSPEDDTIPLMLNYTTINGTTRAGSEKFFCLSNFTKHEPPAEYLEIPDICMQKELTIKSIQKNGNQESFRLYFTMPSALRAPSYDCLLNTH